jgi:hypothetical protein
MNPMNLMNLLNPMNLICPSPSTCRG